MKKKIVTLMMAMLLLVTSNVFALQTGTKDWGGNPPKYNHTNRLSVVSSGSGERRVGAVSATMYFNGLYQETFSINITSSISHSVNAGINGTLLGLVGLNASYTYDVANEVGTGMAATLVPGNSVGRYTYYYFKNYNAYWAVYSTRVSTIFYTGPWNLVASGKVYEGQGRGYVRLIYDGQ